MLDTHLSSNILIDSGQLATSTNNCWTNILTNDCWTKHLDGWKPRHNKNFSPNRRLRFPPNSTKLSHSNSIHPHLVQFLPEQKIPSVALRLVLASLLSLFHFLVLFLLISSYHTATYESLYFYSCLNYFQSTAAFQLLFWDFVIQESHTCKDLQHHLQSLMNASGRMLHLKF